MPAASAGLLRFFEEETPGFRLRPEVIVILAIALILASVLSYIFSRESQLYEQFLD